MRLYNSQTKQKEIFKPLDSNKVSMYVCGITPYDVTHVGHAATYVFFDTLRRYLTFKGYDVNYTQNVTDIDDDILKRAKELGEDWKELGNRWVAHYLGDMKVLNVAVPTHYVRATEYIPTIIRIVEKLLAKGNAYVKEGTVYFDVSTFNNYGKLSGYGKEEMKTLLKERGGNPDDPAKKHPLDFILWQNSKSDVLSGVEGPSWNSPWGRGRPGWHIECSAMISDTLGKQIDLHGGGLDLIYPHHESEIAQSESYTGKRPFVKCWLHTAMVRYQGEKMSKSLGNLVLISDLRKKYSANAIRYLLLSYHYREAWEFDEKRLEWAEEQINRIKKSADANFLRLGGGAGTSTTTELKNLASSNSYMDKFIQLMDNDMDTLGALKLMDKLAQKADDLPSLRQISSVLGFV